MADLTDNSYMPFGKYKGDKMADVPASYLIWLYDNSKCSMEVLKYIHKNHDVLVAQAKKENK